MFITLLTLLIIAFFILYGVKKDNDMSFWGKETTTAVKGIASIIVILVHFEPEYQNPLQDAVGSFAYVGVTLFFMISAYGMMYSLDKNPNYLKSFWTNRLSSLLIPNFLVNAIFFFLLWLLGNAQPLKFLWNLNFYVVVLLEFCLLFFLVMYFRRTAFIRKYGDLILILGVISSSLYLYFNFPQEQRQWCYERWGLIWGILLYRFKPTISQFLKQRTTFQNVIAVIAGILLGFAYLRYKAIWFFGEYLLKIVLGFVLIYIAATFTRNLKFRKPVNLLGNISYEIYLSHEFVMLLLVQIAPTLSSGPFILLTLLLTIALSYIIHKIDSPIVRCLRR